MVQDETVGETSRQGRVRVRSGPRGPVWHLLMGHLCSQAVQAGQVVEVNDPATVPEDLPQVVAHCL